MSAPTSRLSSLSASFPAHDEEENVVPMIESLLEALPQVAERFEVIVVDDGSRDRTHERAQSVAERDARVRVIRHPTNRGYGAAVARAFSIPRTSSSRTSPEISSRTRLPGFWPISA